MINFMALQRAGAQGAADKMNQANEDAAYYRDRAEELTRWSNSPYKNRTHIEYQPDDEWPDQQYEVFIPPFALNHFEGESIVGPFGTSNWPTWEEAKAFFDSVLADIEAGKYGEEWTA